MREGGREGGGNSHYTGYRESPPHIRVWRYISREEGKDGVVGVEFEVVHGMFPEAKDVGRWEDSREL